jgi:pyruvate,water dikinase
VLSLSSVIETTGLRAVGADRNRTMTMAMELVLPFEAVGMGDVPRVGGKNASLGEMIGSLAGAGIRVPPGFAVTADAYRLMVAENGLGPKMAALLGRLAAGDATLRQTGEAVRALFLAAPLPSALADAIAGAYERMGAPAVAVRSSATAEDLPDASFAGQQETFLNVRGTAAVLDACRRCYASLFTDRAITYRTLKGFDHDKVALSIGVQRMVRSDIGGAGVMFTLDPETGFPGVCVISAAWGLGETVVQGTVDPDRYVVFKPLLDVDGTIPVIGRERGAKACKIVHDETAAGATRLVETSEDERTRLVLDDAEALAIARAGVAIERHYGRPMDVEWAKDGETGEIFIVQARPETVQARISGTVLTTWRLGAAGRVLATGSAVGQGVAAGRVCVIDDPSHIESFVNGSILVTAATDPDWVPLMKRAAGIVTDHGGTTSHAAIISRELGLPAIVGTGTGTRTLADGQEVTLAASEGDEGHVYEGRLPFEKVETELGDLPRTRTRMMINVASPAAAFQHWRLPVDGVGLARMEFILGHTIRVHPMALVAFDNVTDRVARAEIECLTRGHADKTAYFVDTLALGIGRIAAAFHPRPVVVRLSDFKSNEYARLVGGAAFEPDEENPMLGLRGASRYYSPRYAEGFALECRALAKVRGIMGFENVIVMVPFCRTPAEADKVLDLMARHGLGRGMNGLKVYMMCEIPANVIQAEEFARRFDGFSIGSNDLTQLVLGVDRDSSELKSLFDERDVAVTTMIRDVIRRAHHCGIPVGICGQAPSDHAEFAALLVEAGIDSISLNPDSFVAGVRRVHAAETASS